jgi:hypothetical protein
MTFLFTHHDSYHIHAVLGLFVLISFLTRLINIVMFGTAFPETESTLITYGSILCHGFLPLSSLLLPIPTKRNFSSPMIWPEFRLHSILFGLRHVIATLMDITDSWPKSLYMNILCKTCFIISVVLLAKLISQRYGDENLRTTNAMPYPSSISAEKQEGVKHNYRIAQFYATIHAVIGDATCAYAPLLGIQAAPFLMTLVRKNIISAIWYHRIYSVSLYIPYLIILTRMIHGNVPTLAIFFVGKFIPHVVEPLRVKFLLSPIILWLLTLPICLYVVNILKFVEINNYFEVLFVIYYLMKSPFSPLITNYKVLFLPAN